MYRILVTVTEASKKIYSYSGGATTHPPPPLPIFPNLPVDTHLMKKTVNLLFSLLADLDVLVVWVSVEVRVLRLRLGDLTILLLLFPVAEAQALPAHQPRQIQLRKKGRVRELDKCIIINGTDSGSM